jgi:hypothetical protein
MVVHDRRGHEPRLNPCPAKPGSEFYIASPVFPRLVEQTDLIENASFQEHVPCAWILFSTAFSGFVSIHDLAENGSAYG